LLKVESSVNFGKEHGCPEVWISETAAGGKSEFQTISHVQGNSIRLAAVLTKSYKSGSGFVTCVSQVSKYHMNEEVEYYHEDKWDSATVCQVRGQILLILRTPKTDSAMFGMTWVNSDLPNTIRKLQKPHKAMEVEQTQPGPHLAGGRHEVERIEGTGFDGLLAEQASQIEGMGIDRSLAEQAVRLYPNDVDRAIEWIFDGADKTGVVEPVQKYVIQETPARPQEAQVQPQPQVSHRYGACSSTNGKDISQKYPCDCGTAVCDMVMMEHEDEIGSGKEPIFFGKYQICNATANSCEVSCVDDNDGATDISNFGCVEYFHDPSRCGSHDDWDNGFDAKVMCCGCEGGQARRGRVEQRDAA
jgi:hypothetical protein